MFKLDDLDAVFKIMKHPAIYSCVFSYADEVRRSFPMDRGNLFNVTILIDKKKKEWKSELNVFKGFHDIEMNFLHINFYYFELWQGPEIRMWCYETKFKNGECINMCNNLKKFQIKLNNIVSKYPFEKSPAISVLQKILYENYRLFIILLK